MTTKELDAIDACLRVLIPELPSNAMPTRNSEQMRIVQKYCAAKNVEYYMSVLHFLVQPENLCEPGPIRNQKICQHALSFIDFDTAP